MTYKTGNVNWNKGLPKEMQPMYGKKIKGKYINCGYCNKEIWRKNSLLKNKQKNYCSRKCKDYGLGLQLSKQIKIKCTICNKELFKSPSRLRYNKLHSCSKECAKKISSITQKQNPIRYWKGKNRTEETKHKIRLITIKRRKQGDFQLKPNKREIFLIQLFQQYNLPFRYTGDAKFHIGYYNPDFVNEENKKIIEFDGKYWHSLPKQIIKDKQRNLAYLNAGWDMMCINEDNLKDEAKLVENIKTFWRDVI